MRRAIMAVLLCALAGCAPAVSPATLQRWRSTPRFTCCNLHYDKPSKINDANYHVGALLPFGSPVTITAMTTRAVTFGTGEADYTVTQEYGADQESAQQYFAKLLVDVDPHGRFASFSRSVQSAITDGRVEKGMTKEQVLMSLGYPPTHRTASTQLDTWTYWYNRWFTFVVDFDPDGFVSGFRGHGVPTHDAPVTQLAAPAALR